MDIRVNNYVNTMRSFSTKNDIASKTQNDDNIERESKADPKTDTITISVAGKEFTARKKESDSEMFAAEIDDIDSFRSALKSMNNLEVNWNAVVDPYGTFSGAARMESYIKQLQDPNVSHNVNDMEKVADQYVQERLNSLIEKKKAYIASQPENYMAREAEEYKMAYDAYHSENGNHLIDIMSGDMKKAYGIYKSILDGEKTSLDDEEFLMLYNNTMYRGAKGEYYRKQEEMYNK